MPGEYMPASRARAHFTRERLAGIFDFNPSTGVLSLTGGGSEITAVNNSGYLWVWVDGAALLVHRVAWRLMTGEWPAGMLDHIDGNRANNSWANLRETDHSRNAQNMHKAMRTNKTGILGVHLGDKRHGKPFRSGIEVDGRKISLGGFDTKEEAQKAYLKAKAEIHPTASITWTEKAAA